MENGLSRKASELQLVMRNPPNLAFVFEALTRLEHLQRKLADLPSDAELDKATLQASIRELRDVIRAHEV